MIRTVSFIAFKISKLFCPALKCSLLACLEQRPTFLCARPIVTHRRDKGQEGSPSDVAVVPERSHLHLQRAC